MASPGTSMPRSRFASPIRSLSRCATSTRKFEKPGRVRSAAEEGVQEQRQHQAQQQAGDDREGEVDVAAVDRDITRELAEIGDSQSEGQEEADDDNEATDNDEELADVRHALVLTAAAKIPSPGGALGGFRTRSSRSLARSGPAGARRSVRHRSPSAGLA